MITYRVDSDGNICEINTPLTAERWSDEYDKAIENDVFRQAYSLNNQIYREYLDAIGTHIPYGLPYGADENFCCALSFK